MIMLCKYISNLSNLVTLNINCINNLIIANDIRCKGINYLSNNLKYLTNLSEIYINCIIVLFRLWN